MRWTRTLIPTQKEAPADAQVVSHQLLVRAGMIRQLTAGVYDYLPLGLRSLRKAAEIVREEMDRIGGAEVLLPALQPLELWQQTGRDVAYGDNLLRLRDRHGRHGVLGPTHEEVITELVAATVNSYKQLPLTLYQIQTKFRDEFRPRFGLLRVREFLMKDAYSFHADTKTLDDTYQAMFDAYVRIFTRCGIPYAVVEAESGPIGGSASHEFMVPCPAGEDTIVASDKGDYAANLEKAEIGARTWTLDGEPVGTLEQVHTPGMSSIDDVAKFMKTKPKHLLKTMVFSVTGGTTGTKWVVAVVRGDHDVNPLKLARVARETFKLESLELLDNADVRREWAIGFVGPDAAAKNPHAVLIVDPDAAQAGFWVSGANVADHHAKYFNWRRECGPALNDAQKTLVADVRNAMDGDPSPKGEGRLRASKGIEIGHVFKLGTKYSEALKAMYLDEKGAQHPIIMGCYGIGIGRILVAAVESFNDERGIRWPLAIAPFSVVITPVSYEGAVRQAADSLYEQLQAAGIDVLLDDRDLRAGVKFMDADLIGIPWRVTIGEKRLKEGSVELKSRAAAEPEVCAIGGVVARIQEILPKNTGR